VKLYFHSFSTSLLDRDGGTRRGSWLSRSAIKRKDASSISDRVIGIFFINIIHSDPYGTGSTPLLT